MGTVIVTANNIVHNVSLDTLLTQAVDAAREAGKAVMEVYASNFSVELKEDKSPLTLADKRSHEIIVKKLSRIQGGSLPVLSEEGEDIPYQLRNGWEYFWLV